jgi:hypothetical protein
MDLYYHFRRYALAHRMTRPPDSMRRVGRYHLSGHQPIEQHADTSQMLFDGGRGHFLAALLNISGDMPDF